MKRYGYILVIFAALEKNIIISFSSFQKILDYIGVRSYSLYIVHLPVFAFTKEIMFRLSKIYGFNINSSLTIYYILISLCLIILSAELLYQYVETPFIRKRKERSANLVNGFNTSVAKQPSILPI
jgi:peptidoglycan/LPS O-acetylase OafA/YrhL